MKVGFRYLLVVIVLSLWVYSAPAASQPLITCGQTITENTVLSDDLTCPPGDVPAITIGSSNITLDLNGHTLSGSTPGIGVIAIDHEGLTIKNGAIEGFTDGVFLINTRQVIVENLSVRNMTIADPSQFIFAIHIFGSQDVIIRNSFFEFLSVAHKEAIEVYESDVTVSDIEVLGGGAGVSFSFNGTCDPLAHPANGRVTNSKFSQVYVAGIWVACSSSVWIEGNDFSSPPGAGIGIQGDPPFPGAVTGLTITNNVIHDAMIGIEFRGILNSTIQNNQVFDNPIWGIAIRQSLGCLVPQPGWECYNSTGNSIVNNNTWGNGNDLYHHEDINGNSWEGNTCQIREGAEIPACSPPWAALTINYLNGKPGSFFTLEGANFPANSTATITINGYMLGTVPTDSSGDLVFLLNTQQASVGEYQVTAAVNPAASAKFTLQASKPARLQEGQGTVFDVPGGLTTQYVYLPFIKR